MEKHTESEKDAQSRTRIHKFPSLPYEKVVQIRSFFRPVFSNAVSFRIQVECGKIQTKKKHRIGTLFTQCYQNVKIKVSINLNVEESSLLGVSTVLILQ